MHYEAVEGENGQRDEKEGEELADPGPVLPEVEAKHGAELRGGVVAPDERLDGPEQDADGHEDGHDQGGAAGSAVDDLVGGRN